MMKNVSKLALAVLIFVSSTSILASEYLGSYAGFQGFYVGGAGSYNFLQAQTTPSVIYYASASSAGANLNRHRKTLTQTKNQLDGYAEIGYAFVNQQHYYLSFSLFSETHAQKYESPGYSATVAGDPTTTHVSSGFTVRAPNVLGIKMSPGYLVSPNDLIYLNLGGVFGNMKYVIGESYYETSGVKVQASELVAKKQTKDAYGFVGGLGYEHLFAEHMGLFIAYNYTYLSSKAERDTLTYRQRK